MYINPFPHYPPVLHSLIISLSLSLSLLYLLSSKSQRLLLSPSSFLHLSLFSIFSLLFTSMENPPDWDLLAVVRSCCTTTTSTTVSSADLQPSPPPPPPPPPPLPQQQQEACFSSATCSSPPPGVLFQFSNTTTTNNNNPFESPSTTSFQELQQFESPSTTSFQELQDICQPMICTSTTSSNTNTPSNSTTILNHNNHNNNNNTTTTFQSLSSASLASPVSSPSSVITPRSFSLSEHHHQQRQHQFQPQQPTQQQQQQQQQQQHPPLRGLIKPSHVIFGSSSSSISTTSSSHHAQRTKKRKNLMKKVCHVPAEGLSSDMWAWRKYGQKPIKGSPYPRGYYRCSSSKGCMARKQVERNRSDPKMFIVTYTAEHNHPMPTHRNSLAGSTRQKPLSSAETAAEQPSCSSPSAVSLSPLTESKTEGDDVVKEEEDTNEMELSDLILKDDFYVGFEQIDGSDGSDCFSDQFSPSSEFPWLNNSSGSTATAAGGG